MSRLYLKGIGMMVGMIVGAGVFALPYAFAKAGIFWGAAHLFVVFLIILLLHQWYGEVAFYTKGKHRITGYVEIFLGKKAKFLAFLTTLGSYYGSLLIYGILGGLFLTNILNFFDGYAPLVFSMTIFIVGGCLAFLNFRKIAEINFYLTIPIFGFIVYLLLVSLPHLQAVNFLPDQNLFANINWFLPYGIWLFALSGFSVIPEARDIFFGSSIKKFKRVIWVSLLIAAVFYSVFIFTILGVSGSLTTEDALSGIAAIMGGKALLIGSVIGFLAVFTSYVALATDLKGVFEYDYKFSSVTSWIVAVAPPIALFLTGVDSFALIIGLIGTFGIGALGIFIIFMRRNMIKMIKKGGKERFIESAGSDSVKVSKTLEWVVLSGIISAVVYDVWKLAR